MILENIKNFDWYNDPKNVRFIEEGLLIETAPQTDFWQNADCGFFKDNGHFFSSEFEGDFIINAKWSFRTIKDSAQSVSPANRDSGVKRWGFGLVGGGDSIRNKRALF